MELVRRKDVLWITAETGALEAQSRVKELQAVNLCISCDEKLPEVHEDVLVFYDGAWHFGFRFSNDGWMVGGEICYSKEAVPYWIPLPKRNKYKNRRSKLMTGLEYSELMDCPFCGKQIDDAYVKVRRRAIGDKIEVGVLCDSCGVGMSTEVDTNTTYANIEAAKMDVVSRWNRRAKSRDVIADAD